MMPRSKYFFALSLLSAVLPLKVQAAKAMTEMSVLSESSLKHLALDLGKGLGAQPPQAAPGSSVDQTGIAVYTCAIHADEETQNAEEENVPVPAPSESPTAGRFSEKPLFRPFNLVPGRKTVGMYTDNDDIFFDIIKGGNDTGYTFGGGISYEQVLNRKSLLGRSGDVIGIELNTSLYTVRTRPDYSQVNKIVEGYNTSIEMGQQYQLPDANGVMRPVIINSVAYDGTPARTLHQVFLNANKLKIFKQWNREGTFFGGSLAFESRQTTGNPVGVAIQEKFHEMINAYHWKSHSPDGEAGKIEQQKIGIGTTTYPGQATDVIAIKATPDFPGFPALKNYGDWAVTSGATVGKRVNILRGSCQIETSVSGDLVLQGEKAKGVTQVDPNTNLSFDTGLKAALIKNSRWNDSALNFKAKGSLFYYPVKFDDASTVFSTRGSAELEATPHLGKKGAQLGVAFQIFSPGGRGSYQRVDDKDAILRIAVRYTFSGNKKRVN